MRILFFLFTLFVMVPFVELALLLWLADATSWYVALAIVLATGFIGAALARHQGARAWNRFQLEMRRGEIPAEAASDGVMILLAGVLLITPGLLTDALGFSLLVPWCRRHFRRLLKRWFFGGAHFQTWVSPSAGEGGESRQDPGRTRIIESYVVRNSNEESQSDGLPTDRNR